MRISDDFKRIVDEDIERCKFAVENRGNRYTADY